MTEENRNESPGSESESERAAPPEPTADLERAGAAASEADAGDHGPADTNGTHRTGDAQDHGADVSDDVGANAPLAEQADGATREKRPPLLPRGNPTRLVRGGAVAFAGFLAAFLLLAYEGQVRILGVPLGFVFAAITSFGILDLLGTFDDSDREPSSTVTLGALAMPMATAAGAALAFLGALAGAQSGFGVQWAWGIVVTAAFLGFVAAVYGLGVRLGPWAKDELGEPRPLLRRHGFWVVAIGGILYFPTLGMFSLWDPWETHYGEVAREILARNDWISLWWAQDGWFWSKPILNFWMQALAMATLGTRFELDQMLFGAGGRFMHPEWVVRTPNVLLTIVGMYFLYKGVAKVFGRRAGLIGAVVLATMPDWFFLAHQTMADMPYVAPMTAAMGLLLLGLHTDEETKAKLYEVRAGKLALRVSAFHLVFGAILVCAIPQIVLLVTRNIDLLLGGGGGARGFRPHWDEFSSGSGLGNCGLPGNETCGGQVPALVSRNLVGKEGLGIALRRSFGGFEPFVQATVWSVVLGVLLYVNWGERRLRRLCYLAAWFFAAIAVMGKGPAGFALPVICAAAYIATKKRWSELLRLEIVSGLLIILVVALPWYVAMYVRHGSPFIDRLIFHDMINRAFRHVHDTNEGDDTSIRFYIWQLGYALFPWTGLAPLGLTWWLRRGDSADRGRGDVSVFLVMWFVFSFALFTFMGTKFHHYIFPAVPPAAMLVGIVLDDMMGERRLARRGNAPLYWTSVVGGLALAVYGLSRFWSGSIWGPKSFTGEPDFAFSAVGAALLVLGLVLAFGVFFVLRSEDAADESQASLSSQADEPSGGEAPASKGSDERTASPPERREHESLMVAAAAVGGALVILLCGRDLTIRPEYSDQPGAIRLLQLFTYNYKRPWPDSLDFTAATAAFTLIAVVVTLALTVRSLRRHAAAATLGLALLWGLWGLNVYMVRTAPHWGQREVIEAYYANRATPEEPLVAYQMNWKGENFYTSNRIPAFVSTGANFTTWLKRRRDEGGRVFFFITEHSRLNSLRSEVQAKSYREMTNKELNNKFILVRAEF
jgi:4-amino-4-deoxy-L-arabinose transferase-like glycosyltransferase